MPERSFRFFPEIESLRGIASLLVMLLHVQGWVSLGASLHGYGWPLGAFVLSGHTGVSLFFVVSGFLLTKPFLVEAAGGPPVDLWLYARRRVLRVMPLYAVIVILAAVLLAHQSSDLLRALPYLAFLQAAPQLVVPLDPFSTVWWSLSTEVQFYLLLPLVVLTARHYGRVGGAAFLLIGVLVYCSFVLHLWGGSDTATYLALAHSAIGRAPLFAFGAAAAALDLYWQAAERPARQSRWLIWDADLLVAGNLVALAILLRWVATKGYWQAEARFPGWHVIEGALWTTLLVSLLWLPSHLKKVFCNRLWNTFGVVSFSMYLWHNPLLVYGMGYAGVGGGGGTTCGPVYGVVAIGLCLALSTLSYRIVERPFLRHRFGR
ncbi:MAG: acyltransferase [Deltaproteobacteria bacterium]|nr:acyltransferase [Deltaproteobacteria bacterium]